MKRLSERTEIAMALNFNRYPVIKIDLSEKDDYGLIGTKVRIDFGGEYMIRGKIRSYKDENTFCFIQENTCLCAEKTYQDYLKDVEYANTPIVRADQDILLFLFDSVRKEIFRPVLLHTGKTIDRHCQTPLGLEKFKLSEI